VGSKELVETNLANRLAEGGILPVYGMPTRVRELYLSVPPGGDDKAPQLIDRELDLAITEFEPGAERTKDKRSWRPDGLIGPLFWNYRQDRWESGDPIPSRQWQAFCPSCMYFDEGDHLRPQPGEEVRPCPDCGNGNAPGERGLQVGEGVVPAAFRTSGVPQDGPEGDQSGRAGRAFVAAHVGQGEDETLGRLNASLALFRQGRVYRINNNGGPGFQLGRFFDRGIGEVHGPTPVHGQHWIAGDRGNPVERFSLVAPKTTNVLSFAPVAFDARLDLDPTRAGTALRAAYYTAASILTRTAAVRLDVDPEEIEIAGVHLARAADRRFVGKVVLADHLPNGSGFVQWMADHWEDLLRGVVERTDEFARLAIWGCDCASSCYKCLMSFRNRHLHGLLDRHLGLALLGVLADAGRAVGADGALDPAWVTLARSLRDELAQFLAGSSAVELGGVPGLRSGGSTYAIVHPFWAADMAGGALAAVPNGAVLLDTFNLSRRMAWCTKGRDSFPKRTGGAAATPAAPRPAPPPAPPAGTFRRDPAPPGLPRGREPVFAPLAPDEEIQGRELYLVRGDDGREVVGRLARLTQQSDGSTRFRFQPVNRVDGLRSFDWDAAERGRILGRLS
jgi:hypothetical protein